jgi:hypothetical protein
MVHFLTVFKNLKASKWYVKTFAFFILRSEISLNRTMLAMKFELQTVHKYFVSACAIRILKCYRLHPVLYIIFISYSLFINSSPELVYSPENVFEGISDNDVDNYFIIIKLADSFFNVQ